MPESQKGVAFCDRITFDTQTKRAISMRDGCIEYLGAELGLEPSWKTFRIYRSAATVANCANRLPGVPLTDDHVSLHKPVERAVGKVETARLVDLQDEKNLTNVGVENTITVQPEILGALETGKRELSLGYNADLFPSSVPGIDLEQRELVPHHLAVVTNGRCGPVCSFVDKKSEPEQMPKPDFKRLFFKDEDQLNMDAVVAVMGQLPDAIQQMPLAELQKLLPMLQAAVAKAQGQNAAADGDAEPAPEPAPAPAPEPPAAPQADAAPDGDEPPADEGDKPEMKDSAAFKDAVVTAVADAVKGHTAAVEHARQFLDEQYKFVGKATEEIMRDALTTEYGKQAFSDAELPIAFKMLKKRGKLGSFGDGAPTQKGRFSAALADKEI